MGVAEEEAVNVVYHEAPKGAPAPEANTAKSRNFLTQVLAIKQ